MRYRFLATSIITIVLALLFIGQLLVTQETDHAYNLAEFRKIDSYGEFKPEKKHEPEKGFEPEEHEPYKKIIPKEMHHIIPVVIDESEKYNLDPLYILSVIKQESNFNPNAVSPHQDLGLMQIAPNTLPYLAEELGYSADKSTALNPVKNIKMGCYYLSQHYEKYNDPYLALTAYSSGPRRALSGRNSYSVSVMDRYYEYKEGCTRVDVHE